VTGAKFTPDREGCACVICGAWRSGHAPDGRCLPPPVAPPKRAATVKAAQRAVARYLAEVEVELDDQGREVELPRTPPLPSGIVRALLLAFEDRADPKRGRAAAWAVVRAVLGAALVLALAACGGGSTSTVDACHENSDCAAGLVCALGACREPCATSADCAAGL
jgi:hypothetical protein